KAARGCLLAYTAWAILRGVARTHRAGETSAELLDAAGFDDAGLGARVEGVRFRRYVALEERVGLAFVFDGFTGVDRGTGDELGTRLLIQEYHFTVFGVDAFFHVDSCRGNWVANYCVFQSCFLTFCARFRRQPAVTYPWITSNFI